MKMEHTPIQSKFVAVIAVLTLTLSSILAAAPPSGGGGGGPNKVSVINADPSEATQGQELDVIVTGSGFDSGSQVSYLVTGTTDGSQVDVLSVQYISSTELRTRIRPKDAAPATDYDIEVRTLSGRKGKGTTLFRVKLAENACTGEESKVPAIAYLTERETTFDVNTRDLYVSSRSGCDHYLLLENAVEYLSDTPQNNGINRFIRNVNGLRVDVQGNLGVVTWQDTYQTPWALMGIVFTLEADGSIILEPGSPWQLYKSVDAFDVVDADVHISDAGEIELVMLERSLDVDPSLQIVSIYNVATDSYQVISSGDCHVQDQDSVCYAPRYNVTLWDPSGDAFYFTPENSVSGERVVARVVYSSEGWGQPELVMSPAEALNLRSVSRTGLLAYTFEQQLYNKRGRPSGSHRVMAIADIAGCIAEPCTPAFGELANQPAVDYDRWTADGAILFIDSSNGQLSIQECVDPLTGALGSLRIEGTDTDFDTVQ